MNIFGGLRESTDVSDINKTDKPEISSEAKNRFEQIMGDVNLPEADVPKANENQTDSTYSMDKFENILKTDAIFTPQITQGEVETEADVNQLSESNSEYSIGDDTYETDDIGNTYKKNGELLPDTEYTVNGNTYHTDEYGHKISCDAEPKICENGKRNIAEQKESGGEDRKEGDQGGHIIARILGGTEGEENLVPMRRTINQGDYKKMELEIKKALEEGKHVSIHIDIDYDEDSSRPTKIAATYMIDGKKTEAIFDNEENSTELIDMLSEKIFDKDFSQLKDEIDDMKNEGCPASITSVKTEFDESSSYSTKVIVGVLDESTGTKSYKVFDAR